MKKLFLCAFMATGLFFASCQGDKNNQNTEESVGDDINDEVGGPEGGFDNDAPGEEQIGGEAIGTEEDSLGMENDTTQMQ